jgi:hypothetical protein
VEVAGSNLVFPTAGPMGESGAAFGATLDRNLVLSSAGKFNVDNLSN